MDVRPKAARPPVQGARQAGRPGRHPLPPSLSHRPAAGFTLFEVLVAFIIMSLALVALLRGGATGMSNVEVALRTERAVAIAQSHLSSFNAQPNPADEDLQGDDGEYHWRMQVAPIATIPVRPVGRSNPGPTSFYQVWMTVSWIADGRRSAIELETKRLSPMPPDLP